MHLLSIAPRARSPFDSSMWLCSRPLAWELEAQSRSAWALLAAKVSHSFVATSWLAKSRAKRSRRRVVLELVRFHHGVKGRGLGLRKLRSTAVVIRPGRPLREAICIRFPRHCRPDAFVCFMAGGSPARVKLSTLTATAQPCPAQVHLPAVAVTSKAPLSASRSLEVGGLLGRRFSADCRLRAGAWLHCIRDITAIASILVRGHVEHLGHDLRHAALRSEQPPGRGRLWCQLSECKSQLKAHAHFAAADKATDHMCQESMRKHAQTSQFTRLSSRRP